jgi:hypothetical protein
MAATRCGRAIVTVAAALCAGGSSLAAADVVHKCTTSTGVIYQRDPCASGQAAIAVLQTVGSTPRAAVSVPAPAVAEGSVHAIGARTPRWSPRHRVAIEPGMTDDEVLNTPDGGVPTRIQRSRGQRAWHEIWTYEARDGTARELEFTNGKLTAIVPVAGTPVRVALVQ